MINCINCNRKLFSMSDVVSVQAVGFLALFGNCKHCGKRQPVNTLWRKTKTVKWAELPPERKKRKVK